MRQNLKYGALFKSLKPHLSQGGFMMDQKTLEQKAMQLQMHREESRQAQQQIMHLQAQLRELENVRQSIELLQKEKGGPDALIPLGAGIFLGGKLGDTSGVLVSAGAGIVVKKTIPEAVAFLEDKSGIIKKAIAEVDAEIRKLGISAQQISAEMQAGSSVKKS